jgi:glycosyltransferase involved in cell wall biosynthesis
LARVRVSVLLPVRDAAGTLAACLRSLRAQTLREHEVVAVDDGSADGSLDVLREFALLDPRVRIVRTGRRGLVSALNTSLDTAGGELVARMDADDIAHPDRLALQAAALPGRGHILGCRVQLLSAPGQRNGGMERYVRWQNGLLDHDAIVRDLLVESPLAHPTVLMARQTLRALGGYRDFDGPEDYDLWLRAKARGVRFSKFPAPLVLWRDRPGRLSRTDPRYGADRFMSLKVDALEGPLKASRGAVVWGAGRVGKSWSRALRHRGHPLLAFVEVDPRKIGRRIHGAIVLPVGQARVEGALHLAAVGQEGGRDAIREEGRKLGLRDGTDLIAVA